MKRFLLLIFTMCFFLTACSGKEEKTEPEEDFDGIIELSEDGEWQGNRYVLGEYNFIFEKPESWKTLLDSEINQIYGAGSSDYYKMIVANNTGKLIVTLFFENSGGLDQEKYMDEIKSKMESEDGVTYAFEPQTLDVVGGMEFSIMKSSITEGGEGAFSNQTNLVHEQGERMMCINIKYEADYQEAVNTMLEKYFISSVSQE